MSAARARGNRSPATGPLAGLRVLEFEAVGAAPFAGMLLADMGADVLLVDRVTPPQLGVDSPRRTDLMLRGRRSVTLDLKTPDGVQAALQLADGADVLLVDRETPPQLGVDSPRRTDLMLRGRRSVTLDLKSAEGVQAALRLADKADVLIEGLRPGVMERLGLGPDVLLARNARIVYGRMTGWGQTGPLAARAGHDINYIALAGVLGAIGRAGQPPVPPLNLVGDFGGGMLLAFGVACGVIEARQSGRGQVIDAAMIDSASLMTTMFAGMTAAGQWRDGRGVNLLDSGAPWYDSYTTRDGQHVAIGPLEPRFYAVLIERLGLAQASLPAQHDRTHWPEMRATFTAAFRSRTRDEWGAVFDGADACVAPVLSFAEARTHPHNIARSAHVNIDGIEQPAPAPRFERTPGGVRHGPPARGALGHAALADWGFTPAEIERLMALGLGASG